MISISEPAAGASGPSNIATTVYSVVSARRNMAQIISVAAALSNRALLLTNGTMVAKSHTKPTITNGQNLILTNAFIHMPGTTPLPSISHSHRAPSCCPCRILPATGGKPYGRRPAARARGGRDLRREPRLLRQTAGACGVADARPTNRAQTRGAANAGGEFARSCAAALPPHHRFQTRNGNKGEPAGGAICHAQAERGWVTDITYLWTLEGWLYLAVILNRFRAG